MTPEERSLLERTYKLTEENNDILRALRRSNRVAMVMRVLYWVVILAISFGAYYLIQPYVNAVFGSSEEVQNADLSNPVEVFTMWKDLLK